MRRPKLADDAERRRMLFHEIVVLEKHPRTLAEEWQTTPQAITAELAELELWIPYRLMPVDPLAYPTTRRNRFRSRALQPHGWLTPGEAAAILGVTTKGARAIAERDGIEVRWTDGRYGAGLRGERRYNAADVRRVAHERARLGRDQGQWWIKENQDLMQARRRATGRVN